MLDEKTGELSLISIGMDRAYLAGGAMEEAFYSSSIVQYTH